MSTRPELCTKHEDCVVPSLLHSMLDLREAADAVTAAIDQKNRYLIPAAKRTYRLMVIMGACIWVSTAVMLAIMWLQTR